MSTPSYQFPNSSISDEVKKSNFSQEFQNFMKETLFETKILDYIDQEFIINKKNDDFHPSINYPSIIQPFITKIKELGHELHQLINHFTMLASQTDSVKKIRDLFEATAFEFGVREKERNLLLDKIILKDQQQIQQLNKLMKDNKKQSHELGRYQKYTEIKSQRQTGLYKDNPTNFKEYSIQNKQILDDTTVYDWIVDIDLMTQIADNGWIVQLSPKFLLEQGGIFDVEASGSGENIEHQFDNRDSQLLENIKKNETTVPQTYKKHAWDGASVAVTGLYDKGKTFVLNNLTLSNLPSGKKVNTKGISFKHVNVDNGTNLILVDTAGSYSPIKIENELSIVEKEATEMFILDLVFDIADYFICVVNDFTSLDQRYLDRLSRNLSRSPTKTFREIIVIHNLKDLESPEILEHVWATQITQIYANGIIQKTKVAAINPQNQSLQEKHVLWFKTQYTRHVCLVNEDSVLGMSINPWVFSLLRYWLKAVFIPVNRPFSIVESILNFARIKLSQYFRTNLNIKMVNTNDPLIKIIKTDFKLNDNKRIPQVSIDQSGLIMARPDSFLPATDIIAGESYIIYMDVPGLVSGDIEIYRQNVITIVKGIRKKPYDEYIKLEKGERKYGEFTLTFRIPDIYEKKWDYFGVENGVITIIYKKDKEEEEQ